LFEIYLFFKPVWPSFTVFSKQKKAFFLCHTRESTIFEEGVLSNHNGTLSLPSKVLFTHNKQKAEGLRVLSTCSNSDNHFGNIRDNQSAKHSALAHIRSLKKLG